MNNIYTGDCIKIMNTLDPGSVNCCVTSPPYWGLRDYGHDDQIGLEQTPEDYVAKMVEVFRAVRRVLRDDGTVWLNLGDSYSSGWRGNRDNEKGDPKYKGRLCSRRLNPHGIKPKDQIGIPWRVAFALQKDGWWLRQDIIWHKPNPMPESVTDRCTKAHEYIFLLSKKEKYYFDADAIKEPARPDTSIRNRDKTKLNNCPGRKKMGGLVTNNYSTRNRRSVWTVSSHPFKEAHFATFPPKLIEPCILAGCPVGGVVLDPFMGAGTTALVAATHGRQYVGCELNAEYVALAQKRINNEVGLLT